MKVSFLTVLWNVFLLCFSTVILKAQDVETILERTYQAVLAHEELSYGYHLEINYPSEDYTSSRTGTVFLNFKEQENPLGFVFQFADQTTKIVYNGGEVFELDLIEKTSKLSRQPQLDQLTGFSFLNNSLVTLRNAIPVILETNSIRKTLLANERGNEYYAVRVEMGQQSLGKLGKLLPLTAKRNISYTILVDRQSYLPVQVIQQNDVAKDDYVRTSFVYNKADQAIPAEKTWYFSNYPDFSPKKKETIVKLDLGSQAPAWELLDIANQKRVASSSFSGSYLLLEFWIKNCGYCISAVPKLNALQEKYQHKGLKIIGVNAADTESDYKSFITRNRPQYTNVWDVADQVTKSFGVIGFPEVFLIDKTGKLIFQGSVDSEKLEALLLAL